MLVCLTEIGPFVPTGAFVPRCNEEGYYKATQCHGSTGQCWCVDKYGNELAGSRKQGTVSCGEYSLPHQPRLTQGSSLGRGHGRISRASSGCSESALEMERWNSMTSCKAGFASSRSSPVTLGRQEFLSQRTVTGPALRTAVFLTRLKHPGYFRALF